MDDMEIAGFQVTVDGRHAVMSFTAPEDFAGGVPADVDERLAAAFGPGGALHGKTPILTLHNAPAISSRQLGAMLAVRRAVGTEEKIEVRGAHRQVRNLLEMTHMTEFFSY